MQVAARFYKLFQLCCVCLNTGRLAGDLQVYNAYQQVAGSRRHQEIVLVKLLYFLTQLIKYHGYSYKTGTLVRDLSVPIGSIFESYTVKN